MTAGTVLPLPDRGVSVRGAVPIVLEGRSGAAISSEWLTFDGLADPAEHVAIALSLAGRRPRVPLVRIHSECLTGDVFGSRSCDCGAQLRESIDTISAAGGYLLYLRQEGRGIGLYAKLDAYALQQRGMDTFQANRALGRRDDDRSYLVAAQMLSALGIEEIDLMTNNPDKVQQLRRCGIGIREVVPTEMHLTDENRRYLSAKAAAGHHF